MYNYISKILNKIFNKFSLIILLSLIYPVLSSAQNLDNSCENLSKTQINELVQDLKIRKFSITELSDCQRRSYDLFAHLVKIKGDYFKHADDRLKNDSTFIKNFVVTSPDILNHISIELKSDPVFIKSMSMIYDRTLQYASYDLVDNRIFMKEMVEINPRNFIYASSRLQNDFDFTLFSVKKDGSILRYASEEMRNNKEIALEATKSHSIAAGYISKELQGDSKIEKIVRNSNYSFLTNIDSFLLENYAGVDIGPRGSRGYRIVNQGKELGLEALVDRKDFFKWKYLWKNSEKGGAKLTTGKLQKIGWKKDLKEYPDLIKKINIFLNENLDHNTSDALTLTSLWRVSSNPDILIFKIYLLRNVENVYNKLNTNNTSYVLGIAFNDNMAGTPESDDILPDDLNNDGVVEAKKGVVNDEIEVLDIALPNENKTSEEILDLEGKEDVIKESNWILTIVDSTLDVDLENNIILKNGHKEYDFWDVYKNGDDVTSNLIFRVQDQNSEYFEIFSKQNNHLYKSIFRGGGYTFN